MSPGKEPENLGSYFGVRIRWNTLRIALTGEGGAQSRSPLGWAPAGGARECLTGIECFPRTPPELVCSLEPSPASPASQGTKGNSHLTKVDTRLIEVPLNII